MRSMGACRGGPSSCLTTCEGPGDSAEQQQGGVLGRMPTKQCLPPHPGGMGVLQRCSRQHVDAGCIFLRCNAEQWGRLGVGKSAQQVGCSWGRSMTWAKVGVLKAPSTGYRGAYTEGR